MSELTEGLKEIMKLIDKSPAVTWTGKGGAKEIMQAAIDRLEQES